MITKENVLIKYTTTPDGVVAVQARAIYYTGDGSPDQGEPTTTFYKPAKELPSTGFPEVDAVIALIWTDAKVDSFLAQSDQI